MKKQVGCYFGTFDPIHKGHVQVAKNFLKRLQLDQVWLIVSRQSPFKEKSYATAKQRLEMSRLAVEDIPDIVISDVELQLPAPNYTYESILYLQKQFPELTFSLLMGEDSFRDFPRWKYFTDILRLVPVFAHTRECSPITEDISIVKSKAQLIEFPNIAVSSSAIRSNVKKGKSIEHLVPARVATYIRKNDLYSS